MKDESGHLAAGRDSATIRVTLPYHLRNLAQVEGDVEVRVDGPVTMGSALDALEQRFPVLRGSIRDYGTLRRRPFLRYFACGQDLSLEPLETPLPDPIVSGAEPFIVLGSIAGG